MEKRTCVYLLIATVDSARVLSAGFYLPKNVLTRGPYTSLARNRRDYDGTNYRARARRAYARDRVKRYRRVNIERRTLPSCCVIIFD